MLDDVPRVAAIHMESFPGFFLTFLGTDFLRLLYRGILADPDGIALVAIDEEEHIQGFVAGVLRQSGFYRRLLKKHKWAFARASLAAVLHKPSIAPRLIQALHRPADSAQAAADACLMSIAVRPQAANQGYGGLLVREFCRQLTARGAPAVCLTTDFHDNDAVNRFYQQLGFRIQRTFATPEGRVMNEYVLDLKEQN